ncbi:tetratricopeptide repeat protein [Streptomyces sp. APSN-46.1]|uniref:BTAD domain-containing putative transcriptional regulator n=1 Tax=Streptomyces sp. APSN-46.1 TaxID=2929049 RepID=UPI001FB536EE|nr:BTAD domain-containing putative transcriptional regulator [Streptomyces sp. APSN-46.1]MCJ1678327.1 tetratricopeptide repeat protein [Streptomyces sp. APSN-46.1]
MGESIGNHPRFNILGPLEGWADGTRLRLGGAIQERILVTLLLEPGKVLPVSRLVEAAWDEDPPATATHQVRKAVADLRRRIPDGAGVIVTDGPGYRTAVSDSQLDLTDFGIRVREAKAATVEGSPAEAAELLRSALALWRGPVLGGTGGSVIEAAAAALEERRLAAAEQLCELRLGLGESAELVVDLRELVSQYPLRETLRCQLMLALYRSGRQAEALEEYGKVRELLVEELGIDPGPQLTKMYAAILQESPELAGPEPAAPASAAHAPAPAPAAPAPASYPPAPVPAEAPCTLPYDLADFTGRDKELAELLACTAEATGQRTRIVAIDGMGGSGKTALAVQAAHRLAAEYPDGQLHIDLRGFTSGEEPVTAGTALDSLLRALGIPGDRIPDGVEGRSALWRATLANKRLLLLLDNAVEPAEITPLLPASPGCLVLITSRARLLDLDGADWISIGVMPPGDSARLVAETLGEQRVAAEPEAAAELAQLCGHLPLALRIATARLRNRPRWTVRYLVARLQDETRRLDELSAGERSVAATLRLSYQVLEEDHRGAFRILALHPGTALDIHSAAALIGTDTREAEDILEFLLDMHLLQQPEIGLYGFHDLVRSFAHSLGNPVTAIIDAAACERLLDYYLLATAAACAVLFPGRRQHDTGLVPSPAELPPLDEARLARGWFTREHTGLLAAVSLADRMGLDRHVVHLTRNLVFALYESGRFADFRAVGRVSVGAARRLGDPVLLGVALSNLGIACTKLGSFAEGIEVAEEGLELAVRRGDRHTEAHSEGTLGLLKLMLGRLPEAVVRLERAIALERELGATRQEAESQSVLSTLFTEWGRYPEAAEAGRRALALNREVGNRHHESGALVDLAFAHAGLGEGELALRLLTQARELYDPAAGAEELALLMALSADVTYRLGQEERSARDAEQALELVRSTAVPIRQSKIENILGALQRRRRAYGEAMELHANAHRIASAINYRAEEAHALYGMAEAAQGLGDAEAAARYRAAAVELFDDMDLPAHRRVR